MGEPHEPVRVDREPRLFLRLPRRRVVGGSQDRFGIVGVRALGEVLGVDAPAGEDPRAAGERELRVTSEHQGLDAVGGVAEQHDGRRGYGRVVRVVVTHRSTPIAPDSTGPLRARRVSCPGVGLRVWSA